MKRSPSFVCKRAKEIVQYTKVFHEYLTIGSKYMSKTSKVYSLLTLFLIFITLFAFNIAAFVYFNGAQRPACRTILSTLLFLQCNRLYVQLVIHSNLLNEQLCHRTLMHDTEICCVTLLGRIVQNQCTCCPGEYSFS